MSIVIMIVVFLIGMYLSIRIIAALYGFIDLWYTIKTAYVVVIWRLIFWSGLAGGLLLLLKDGYRSAFFYGLSVFILVHFIIFLINKYIIARPGKRSINV